MEEKAGRTEEAKIDTIIGLISKFHVQTVQSKNKQN